MWFEILIGILADDADHFSAKPSKNSLRLSPTTNPREPGLGWRNEVVEAVNRILRHPQLPRLRPKGYRRVNLNVFPHYIAYVIREDTIWIVAIAHGYRRPEFWVDRV